MFPFEDWRAGYWLEDVKRWLRAVLRVVLAPLAYALAGVVLGLALIRILLNRSGD